MNYKLYYNTTTPLLLSVLKTLMAASEFDSFRLVGGTALSLYKGHRESADIDLFSDSPYDSIDFLKIDSFLRKTYPYIHNQARIRKGFTDFEHADSDFDPVCLKFKQWEIIKLDLIDFVNPV